jgi:hypothetical protein
VNEKDDDDKPLTPIDHEERRIFLDRLRRDSFALGWKAALRVMARASRESGHMSEAARILNAADIVPPETWEEAGTYMLNGVFK